MAQRRLRQVQPIPGPRQAPHVGDGGHQLQVADFQIHRMMVVHRLDDDKEFPS
jgi:hypothetical protein